MTKLSDLHQAWMLDPAYAAAHDSLDQEFALADALIRARAAADMTQAQVAEAMGTTQTAIARLESGKSMPSTRTLQRFAIATGTRLRISFDVGRPTKPTSSAARVVPPPNLPPPNSPPPRLPRPSKAG